MIRYKTWGLDYVKSALTAGVSVFPMAFAVALPCAVLAALLRLAIERGIVPDFTDEGAFMKESQAWTGFTALLGFLIVFRTHQSYNRFWEASGTIYTMQAHVFDSASSLMSFTTNSKAPVNDILQFKHTMIRLLSMMHACAMGSLYGSGIEEDPVATFSFEMIDPGKLDKASRAKVKGATFRMELVYSWVLNAITRGHEAGVLCVPPPVLSRVNQTLSNSMTAYQDATRISDTPFPLPYAHTCDLLMGLDWAISPFAFSHFSVSPMWAGIFCFLHVFVLWALNFTAVEIETPFGTDAHDLDLHSLQKLLNGKLSQLLSEDVLMEPIAKTVSVNEQCLPTSTRVNYIEAEHRTTRRFDTLCSRNGDLDTTAPVLKRFPSDKSQTGDALSAVSPRTPRTPMLVERRQVLGHGEMLDAHGRWEVFDGDGSSGQGTSRTGSKESRRGGAGQEDHDPVDAELAFYTRVGHVWAADDLVVSPLGASRAGSKRSCRRHHAEDEVACAEGPPSWRAVGDSEVKNEAHGRAYESQYLDETGAPETYLGPPLRVGARPDRYATFVRSRDLPRTTEILV